ncbi:MAG: transposase [Solirubrobacteraceae bacterium]
MLVPPDGAAREGKRPGWEDGVYEQMREKLQTDRGRTLYALRKITIEPIFGQIKYNRRVDQFMRRDRAAVINFGVTGDLDTAPDIGVLCRAIERGVAELLDAPSPEPEKPRPRAGARR